MRTTIALLALATACSARVQDRQALDAGDDALIPTLEVSISDTGWPPDEGFLRITPASVFSLVDTSTVPPTASGATTFTANFDRAADRTSIDVTADTTFLLDGTLAGALEGRRFTPNAGLAFDQIGATADVVASYHAASARSTIVVVASRFGGAKHDPLTTDVVLVVTACSVVAQWPGGDLLTFSDDDAARARVPWDGVEPSLIAGLAPADCLEPVAGRTCLQVLPNDGALHALHRDRVTFARQFVDAGATHRAVTFVIMYKTLKPC